MWPVVIVVVLPLAQLLVEQVDVVPDAGRIEELIELLVVRPQPWLRGEAVVAMVQAADFWRDDDRSDCVRGDEPSVARATSTFGALVR